MEHVILVIHLILTVSLIGLILLQRSEGGGLGVGGGGGGMGNFATAQSTANALTKATQIVAGLFFATSLILAVMASHRGAAPSILDAAGTPAAITKEAPVSADPADASKADASKKDEPKKAPAVPISQ